MAGAEQAAAGQDVSLGIHVDGAGEPLSMGRASGENEQTGGAQFLTLTVGAFHGDRLEPCGHRFAGRVEEVINPSCPHRFSDKTECRTVKVIGAQNPPGTGKELTRTLQEREEFCVPQGLETMSRATVMPAAESAARIACASLAVAAVRISYSLT